MTKVGSGAEEEREHRKGFYGGLATLYSWQTLSRSSLAANEGGGEKLAGRTGNMAGAWYIGKMCRFEASACKIARGDLKCGFGV
jgi:hypothetical protein